MKNLSFGRSITMFAVLVSSFVMLGLTIFVQPTHAVSTATLSYVADGSTSSCKTKFLGMPTWYEYLPVDAECNIDNNSLNSGTVVVLVIMAILDILITLAGILAVGYVIFGGFKYITSQAEPNKLVGARTTILNALIGLVIAIVASRIVAFIAGRLAAP